MMKSMAKSDPNWIIYDFALGNENIRKEINISKDSVMSSFFEPDNSEIHLPRSEVIMKELVEIKKIDSIIESLKEKHAIENIYLKIDTEGYDLEVIHGAEETLPYVCAIQTELDLIKIHTDEPDFMNTIKVLKQKGFGIIRIYPIGNSLTRMINMDCVLVNRCRKPNKF